MSNSPIASAPAFPEFPKIPEFWHFPAFSGFPGKNYAQICPVRRFVVSGGIIPYPNSAPAVVAPHIAIFPPPRPRARPRARRRESRALLPLFFLSFSCDSRLIVAYLRIPLTSRYFTDSKKSTFGAFACVAGVFGVRLESSLLVSNSAGFPRACMCARASPPLDLKYHNGRIQSGGGSWLVNFGDLDLPANSGIIRTCQFISFDKKQGRRQSSVAPPSWRGGARKMDYNSILPFRVKIGALGMSGGYIGDNGGRAGKRDIIAGWSRQASRRFKRKFQSVIPEELTGVGHAFSLTVLTLPLTEAEWQNIIRRFEKRLFYAGAIRLQWSGELQGRRCPHIHGSVFFPDNSEMSSADIIRHWLLASSSLSPSAKGQCVKLITDLGGWGKYQGLHLALHEKARQKIGMPPGWKKSGRMYRFAGDWKFHLENEDISPPVWFRIRDIVKRYRLSEIRAQFPTMSGGAPCNKSTCKQAAHNQGGFVDSDGFVRVRRPFSNRWQYHKISVAELFWISVSGCTQYSGGVSSGDSRSSFSLTDKGKTIARLRTTPHAWVLQGSFKFQSPRRQFSAVRRSYVADKKELSVVIGFSVLFREKHLSRKILSSADYSPRDSSSIDWTDYISGCDLENVPKRFTKQ